MVCHWLLMGREMVYIEKPLHRKVTNCGGNGIIDLWWKLCLEYLEIVRIICAICERAPNITSTKEALCTKHTSKSAVIRHFQKCGIVSYLCECAQRTNSTAQ